MSLIERFIRYTKTETTSDSTTSTQPSTYPQVEFAKALALELEEIGLSDIVLDSNGYLTATLPSNSTKDLPTIGFLAHLDTSPDMPGKNVKPKIVARYKGGDIVLDSSNDIVLSADKFPEINQYIGQDIIVTSGDTLLGADDKAGIAEIVTAMEFFIKNPDIAHGTVRIAFTPDEEIGRGVDKFDMKAFDCDFAYTIDGGEIGEIEYENFNAASAKITFYGTNTHPGYAKGKLVNAITMANRFIESLPKDEVPERTEQYEGFFHITDIEGCVDKCTVSCIIRDHDRDIFEQRKEHIRLLAKEIEQNHCKTEIDISDTYYNMKEKILPVMHIVDIAIEAIEEAGIKPIVRSIRGGTDGANLSFKGLPCPNIFAGGHNFHSRYEFIPTHSMEKAVEVIVNIIKKVEINN